jgi:pyridoxal phosphate enzyme (YggS family)
MKGSITENAAKLEERIRKACDTAGRKRDEITLMGVSKFVPAGMIEEAFSAGINYFGESRVKEAITKFESFRDKFPAQIHLVGSLQRNKAKIASLFFDCIQSVDRIELITELAKYTDLVTDQRLHPLEILLELRTGEDTKSGFENLDGLFEAAQIIFENTNLKTKGLMTMAPFTTDTNLIRKSFKQLVNAQKELEKRFPPKKNWECLSMGMSNDFEIAIEEGSTMLRIGSLIFQT